MTLRDDTVALRQMLDHIKEAIAYANARSREALDTDRLFCLAMLKLVEIVGEAACRVGEPCRLQHAEIPWREIIGTRNRLVHGYDAVDHDILWEIVTADFPALACQVERVLQSR